MKSKTKKQKNNYPAYYLGIVLAIVLILEGFLMGVATPTAWQESLQVLDISKATNAAMADFAWAVEPLFDQFKSITQFYEMAADEVMVMFDMSEHDVLAFPKGVIEFYDLAAVEMAQLLDFSDEFQYFPQVAGATITQ